MAREPCLGCGWFGAYGKTSENETVGKNDSSGDKDSKLSDKERKICSTCVEDKTLDEQYEEYFNSPERKRLLEDWEKTKEQLNKIKQETLLEGDIKKAMDIEKSVQYVDENAATASTGYCARAIRRALEAGGVDTTGHPRYAKDYGKFLKEKGFTLIDSNGYTPQKGGYCGV